MTQRSYVFVAACLLAASGCSKRAEPESEVAAPVQVAPVTKGPIRRLVEADAVLYPADRADVMPKVTAPVARYLKNRGDRVRANDLLAVLENRDLAAAVAASQAQLQQAEANLQNTEHAAVPESMTKAAADVQSGQEQYDAAKKVLESRQKLLEEGALARKAVEDAAVQFAQAKAQLETAKEHLRALESVGRQSQIGVALAQVEAAKAQLQSAQAQLAYTEIRSPIGGVIADRPVYQGDIAAAGAPLFTVVDVSRAVARVNVPQQDATAVRVGDSATIRLDDGHTGVPGKVVVVSPATDPGATTMQVWVEANNASRNLKLGATVHVTIVTATLENATLVPPAAILPGQGGAPVVMAVTDSTAHIRKVEIGAKEADKVQILSGVSPGEQVISVGGLGLEDNAKVRIVKPGDAGEEPQAK
jgi:HlyD family secretion protein